MRKQKICAGIVMLLAFSAVPVRGEEYKGENIWEVEFTGNRMESNFDPLDFADAVGGLQPGDSIIVSLMLKNAAKGRTDWYMSNEVISSLEDSQKEARGGAYAYHLSYTDDKGEATALYSSENVGGEKESVSGLGLHEAADGLEDFFYLDRLAPGGSGQITLKVALDGETQGNGYQDALADMQMRFAAEKARETPSRPSSSHSDKPSPDIQSAAVSRIYTTGSPQTKDAGGLLIWSVFAGLAGSLLLFYTALYRKNRQRRTGGI